MRILTVGGGSGGHVTPVVAVIKELKKQQDDVNVRFWCDKAFHERAQAIVGSFDSNIPVERIAAGKLRRYNHLSFWQHLTLPSVVFPNLRDLFLIVTGFFQSIAKLIAWRPDVIFLKGGYVCLPVGLAAHILRIPFVIHDSDAHPGLTNRILSRYANKIATGAPLKYYNYPKDRSQYVGIPVDEQFKVLSKIQRKELLERWGRGPDLPLVVITGGGLGAKRINKVALEIKDKLADICQTVLVSGKDDYSEIMQKSGDNTDKFRVYDFISEDMAGLLGAADVVVARAGATSLLELAALAKPTILIPNAKLTGGHQLKNAQVYADANAVIVIKEDELEANPLILFNQIKTVLSSKDLSKKIGENLLTFAKPNAAKDVADMVFGAVKNR